MPAATTKKDLLAVTEKDFAKLEKLLATVSKEAALAKDEEDTSIKDVIGHRAHWIDLFLGWYEDGQADKPVYIPAKGYKWNELKAYNADLREKQAKLTWPKVLKMLHERHQKLTAFIEAKSDKELYGGPMKGSNNKWTPGRFAEASGPSHYRSATTYIRKVLKSVKAATS